MNVGGMKGGMINLCAGRVTYGKKLGYVVHTSTGPYSSKVLVSYSYRAVMYGYQARAVFFFRYDSAKGKRHVPSSAGLSGYRGRVAGWQWLVGYHQY